MMPIIETKNGLLLSVVLSLLSVGVEELIFTKFF